MYNMLTYLVFWRCCYASVVTKANFLIKVSENTNS